MSIVNIEIKDGSFAHDSPLHSVAPTLTGAYNMVSLARLRSLKFLPSAKTSDILEMLYTLPFMKNDFNNLERVYDEHKYYLP